MEARTQFTFYESFFKSVSRIRKAADRVAAYDAICAYALYGTEPDMDKMPDAAAVAFEVARPNLDSSRRRAENGKNGGRPKAKETEPEPNQNQTETKPKPNRKQKKPNQNQNAKTRKQEKEQDKEQVKDKDKEQVFILSGGSGFLSSPSSCAGTGEDDVENPVENYVRERWMEPSPEALKEGARLTGKLFPRWCGRGYTQEDERRVALCVERYGTKLVMYAFEAAFGAGKPGNWNYIYGILRNLKQRGVETLEDAEDLDGERRERWN